MAEAGSLVLVSFYTYLDEQNRFSLSKPFSYIKLTACCLWLIYTLIIFADKCIYQMLNFPEILLVVLTFTFKSLQF